MSVINVKEYFQQHHGESVIRADRRGAHVLALFDAGDKYEL